MVSTPEMFAARLHNVAQQVEKRADELEQKWGEAVAEEMRRRVPVRTGALRDSIRQVEPGGIEIGERYWVYVDRGTSRMPPQEFVRPAVNVHRPKMVQEAARVALGWLRGG